jgi:hypothetical protein
MVGIFMVVMQDKEQRNHFILLKRVYKNKSKIYLQLLKIFTFCFFLFYFYFSLQAVHKSSSQPTGTGKYVVSKNKSPPRGRKGDHITHELPDQEGEEMKQVQHQLPPPGLTVRPAPVVAQKFVVVKKKDDTPTITHQYIVTQTKLAKEKSIKDLHYQSSSHLFESTIETDAAFMRGERGNHHDDFEGFEDRMGIYGDGGEDELKSQQLDLESNAFSSLLSVGSELKMDDEEDASLRLRPTPISSPKSGRRTPKSPSLPSPVPTAPAKTQALSLDLPDRRKETRRKYALAVSAALTKKKEAEAEFNSVVKDAVNKALAGAEDDDDDSEVTHYFDRNAKPIFVSRGDSKEKHVLRRKTGMTYGDGIASKRSRTSSAAPVEDGAIQQPEEEEPTEVVAEKNAAILDMYLEDLNEEEKQMFTGLHEEAKAKLLKEIRKNVGTGKRKNNKTKDLFKKLTKLATDQAKVIAMLSMEITIEPLEVTDEICNLSVTSSHFGPVTIILAYTKTKFIPTKEHFYTLSSLQSIPGYVEHQNVILEAENDNYLEIQFSKLRPECNYTIYAIVNKLSRDHFPITDEEIENEEEQNSHIQSPKSVTFKSLPEKLEIEWFRLNQNQRTIELRSAIRCELIQIKAQSNYPIIILPTDKELFEEKFQMLLNPFTEEEEFHNLKNNHFTVNPSLKHLPIFLDWWVGQSNKGITGKTRALFHEVESFYSICNKKIFKALQEDKLFSSKEILTLTDFAKTSIKTRTRLNREEGTLSTESCDITDDRSLLLFKKYRSWYKGGFVVKELEMKLNRSANSTDLLITEPISSPNAGGNRSRTKSIESVNNTKDDDASSVHSNDSSSIIEVGESNILPQKRLQERTDFLASLLDPVDGCIKQIYKLYEGYQLVVAASIKPDDLRAKRNALTPKEASSIMEAKKFIDLCLLRKVFTKNPLLNGDDEAFPSLELEKIDPFKWIKKTRSESTISMTPSNKNVTRTFPIPIIMQRIAGVDLFRPVNVNTLKADEPPPLELKTLPGTNRRPIKPWQSLSKAEQDLELCLACCLDSIWELATFAGIPVPNPEDRLLNAQEFPHRIHVWETFHKWYAGNEEDELIPGQGIPTLPRTTFAESCEMQQVEKDTFATNLMVKNAFSLPKVTELEENEGMTLPASIKGKTKKTKTLSSIDFDENEDNDSYVTDDLASKKAEQEANLTLRDCYEKAIISPSGAFIRNEMFTKMLTKIFQCRSMNIMKFLWPPGMKRISLQYVYPRSLSFYYPKFSLPLHRYQLWPSRKKETFNREEILEWYNSFELDEDDQIMMRAEKRGVKLRAYHEWLTLEPQRMEYSRVQMAVEDSFAYQHRELNLLLEKRWKIAEERLLKLDEDIDNGDYDPNERLLNKPSEVKLTPREIKYKALIDSFKAEKEGRLTGEAGMEEEVEEKPEHHFDDEITSKKLSRQGTPKPGTPSTARPPTGIGKEFSEILFPQSDVHDNVTGIPPLGSSRLTSRPRTAEIDSFNKYISENMSISQQDELSNVLDSFEINSNYNREGGGAPSTSRTNKSRAFSENSEGLLSSVGFPGGINNTNKQFRLFDSLPQEYWYIFEESNEFKNGSGIYNDDEVEEIVAQQQERAKKAVEDAMEFERVLSVEKKKREMEELARLKREEQDRRLKEGMARRRKIREHLEDLKAQRIQRQQEEEESKRKLDEEERVRRIEEEKALQIQLYLQRIENARLNECYLMGKEEVYMKDLAIRRRELKLMEHEDIISFIMEQMSVQYELMEKVRLKEIEEIYEPFEPFAFKQSRLPVLQSLFEFGDPTESDMAIAEAREREREKRKWLSLSKELQLIDPQQQDSLKQIEQSYALLENEKDERSPSKKKLFSSIKLATSSTSFSALPMPKVYDPSVMSFQSLTKHSNSLNQKIHSLSKQVVKTSDSYPTKRKFRKFFDSTKLAVETLNKPFPSSISMEKKQQGQSEGDMKRQSTSASGQVLPFNSYDTQWELQQTGPPITLSSLPFFVRPSSRGLIPFLPHEEQTLSSPALSRPSSKNASQRPSKPSSSSAPSRLLSPINTSLLQNPMVGTNQQSKSEPDILLISHSPRLVDDSVDEQEKERRDIVVDSSTKLDQPISHYSQESDVYNKTTEVTVDYINSLLAGESQSPDSPFNPIATASVGRDVYSPLSLDYHFSASEVGAPPLSSPSQYQQYFDKSQRLSSLIEGENNLVAEQEAAELRGRAGSLTSFSRISKKSSKGSSSGTSKVKEILSLSSDLIEKNNSQKDWLEYLKLQKQLTTASLSTIDNLEKEKLRRILGKGGIAPVSAMLANNVISIAPFTKDKQRNILSATMPNLSLEGDLSPNEKSKKKKKIITSKYLQTPSSNTSSLTTSKLSSSHSTSELPLDFKTLQLAKNASESVIRLKEQRQLLKEYIAGHAILEEEKNEYYLLACQPELQTTTILERNASIQKFAKEIHNKLNSPTQRDEEQGGHKGGRAAQQYEQPKEPEETLHARFDDDLPSETTSLYQQSDEEGMDLSIAESTEGQKSSRKSSSKKKSRSGYMARTPTTAQILEAASKSLELPALPPPSSINKKQHLSSASSLVLQIPQPSSGLQPLATAIPKESSVISKKGKKKSGSGDTYMANLSSLQAEEAPQLALSTSLSLNPVILGNKAKIHKDTKKDLLLKSKQALFSTSTNNTSKKSLSSENEKDKKLIVTDELFSEHFSTSLGDGSASLELKTGRSLDLFIRTPRVDDQLVSRSESRGADVDAHSVDFSSSQQLNEDSLEG